ncbi:LysR family transcriptional regulator [Cellulosimicrobium marinum]|uniref:LysR family transcriptional regulator n=1 Tax=Cellulosimicrobium marinum TaxID=1638992 RepID=UPI001E4F02C4|nr:LysR family transcriptional regulator [Cellulosimicrobium marinum]MCB7135718.1 LysR family transcriptional regulator [Cellulosimicrobium marinum]
MATDPRRLAFLLAVHRGGGVLAAADLLRVTPSAVSQQIQRLEAEEGVTVLDRGPRGVTLTPAGRVLADVAERIETELVEARKELAALGDEVTGRVAVGAFQSAIRSVVAPVAQRLAETAPGIDLDVQEREPAEALRLLRGGDLDVVLLERDFEAAENPAPRGTHEVVLLEEPWRLVVPASMPTPARLDDVRDAVWLGPQPDTAAARALRRLSQGLGGLSTRHLYYDFDVALSLVAAGLGVAMLPALAVEGGASDEVPDGVTVVGLPGLGSRRLVARHRATRHEPRPAVSAVLDEMVDAAAEIAFA